MSTSINCDNDEYKLNLKLLNDSTITDEEITSPSRKNSVDTPNQRLS